MSVGERQSGHGMMGSVARSFGGSFQHRGIGNKGIPVKSVNRQSVDGSTGAEAASTLFHSPTREALSLERESVE